MVKSKFKPPYWYHDNIQIPNHEVNKIKSIINNTPLEELLDEEKKHLTTYFYLDSIDTFFDNFYDKLSVEIMKSIGLFDKTKYDGIIISYHGSSSSPYASNIIPKNVSEVIEKIGENNSVILSLFLNPYSLNSFEKIDHFDSIIVGYQNNMISQEVMADLMTGTRSFKGKLPVSNNFYSVNHGISIGKNNILGYSRPAYEGFDQKKLSYLDSIAISAIDSMMAPGIQMLVSKKRKNCIQ